MKPVKETSNHYLRELKRRSKKSRVHKMHQLIGLEIAQILGDSRHKSLYIKLVRNHDAERLLMLAKSIAQGKHIKNKGAYFMTALSKTLQAKNSISKNS